MYKYFLNIYILTFVFFVTFSFASVDVSIDAPGIATTDSIFELVIKGNGTGNIAGAQIFIRFDPEKIIINHVIEESGVQTSNIVQANIQGRLILTYLDVNGIGLDASINPILAKINFKPIRKGDTEIFIEDTSIFSDNFFNNITGQLPDSKTIQIQVGLQKINTIWQGPFVAKPGNLFSYDLLSSGTQKIAGASLEIHYEKNMLDLQSVINTDGYENSDIDIANKTGRLMLTYLDLTGNSDFVTDKRLSTLKFVAKSSGKTKLLVKKAEFSDQALNDVSGGLFNRTITIGDSIVDLELKSPISAEPESTFDVDVKAFGYGTISSADIRINFDKEIVNIQKVVSSNGFLYGDIQTANLMGYINIKGNFSLANAIDANTNPLLSTIYFNVIGSDQASISIDNSTFVKDEQDNNITNQKQSVLVKVEHFSDISGNVIAQIAGFESLKIPQANILLSGNKGKYTTQSNDLGFFEFSDIAPGLYHLSIGAPNLETVKIEINVSSGQQLQVNVPKLTPSSSGDINNDGMIGLEEAIHALNTCSGVYQD